MIFNMKLMKKTMRNGCNDKPYGRNKSDTTKKRIQRSKYFGCIAELNGGINDWSHATQYHGSIEKTVIP